MHQEVIEMIREGDLDEHLDAIKAAIVSRQNRLGQQQEFEVGQTVTVTGKLKPNYLLGHQFRITKVNRERVKIWVPNNPMYRRFANQDVAVPKTAVKIVA